MCVCMTHQIYGFSSAFGGVVAPGLAPQPLLGERLDGHLVDHVVGEVLKTEKKKLRKKKPKKTNSWLPLTKGYSSGGPGCTWSRLDRLLGSWLRA